MMKFRYYIFSICALLFVQASLIDVAWKSTTVDEIKKVSTEVSDFFETNKKLSFKIKHMTFKGHTSNSPYQELSGYFCRDNDNLHSYIMGIHTYQNKNFRFVIDTSRKTIIVDNIKSLKTSEEVNLQSVMAQKQLSKCLFVKTETGTIYRVEYKSPYSIESSEMEINKNNSMAGVTIFFRNEKTEKNGNLKAKPKARVLFSAYNLKPVFNASEFDHTKYFTVKGKNVFAAKAYANYQLIDNRIKK